MDCAPLAPPAAGSATVRTYEELIDMVIASLRGRRMLPDGEQSTPWDAFVRLSERIHSSYHVPHTTVTPVMRRLLFALGAAARAAHIVGVGTHVGYAFSWLLGDRRELDRAPLDPWQTALGFDVDTSANVVARRNCAMLGHETRLAFIDGDGVSGLERCQAAIDLLFIDLDHPVTRKAGYRDVLERALPRLSSGALVLAHDSCVPLFQHDFAVYDRFVVESGAFVGPCVLAVDSCGLSVATVR
jgi:predicted O-methyltransferase YrrM